METPTSMASTLSVVSPQSFTAELPSPLQGGGNENGLVNTQFRHEPPEYQQLQNVRPTPRQYPPPQFRPFSISTNTNSLSSGFPYSQRLVELRISPDQWRQFSNQVVNAAKLTKVEDTVAWTAGVATGAGASALLLVFGPVIGYYTGKSIHKKTVVRKVKEKLAEEGDLTSVFRRWNEGVFGERGVQAMLETPTVFGEVLVDGWPGASPKDLEKEAKRLGKMFRIVLVPFDLRIHSPVSPLSPQSQNQVGWSPVSTMPGEMGPSEQQCQELPSDSTAAELPSEQSPPAIFELDGGPLPRKLTCHGSRRDTSPEDCLGREEFPKRGSSLTCQGC